MRNRILQSMTALAVLGTCYIGLSSNSGGQTGSSSSGCSCHGPANQTTTLGFTALPSLAGGTYTPGTVYVCSLTVTHPTITGGAGMNMATNKGVFSSNIGTTGMTINATEMTHSATKANGTFIFTWTAPAAGSGTTTLNIAGNAVNGTGTTSGDAWNKQTLSLTEAVAAVTIPSATQGLASNITTTSATIGSLGTANGAVASVNFEYGTSTTYGNTVAGTPASLAANAAASIITANLTGLTPNTMYHFRAKLNNSAGDGFGADQTFTTLPASIANLSVGGYHLFPNPSANGQFELTTPDAKEIAIYAYDLSGKSVTTQVTKVGNKHIIKVNASAGNYLLRVNAGANAFASGITIL
jgi:hypothetical protein